MQRLEVLLLDQRGMSYMRSRDVYAATDGCVVCGENAVSKRFCRIHLLEHRERERARVGGGA